MTPRECDENGKVFELLVGQALLTAFNRHDIPYVCDIEFSSLDDVSSDVMSKMKNSSAAAVEFLFDEYISELNANSVRLEQLSDHSGRDGNVIDLIISTDNDQRLGISLKHNHDALCHPRISRVPTWFRANEEQHAFYKKSHDEIWVRFFEKAEAIDSRATTFEGLKQKDNRLIDDYLYAEFYNLIAGFLKSNVSNSSTSQALFRSLVGRYDFVKVIDRGDTVDIQDWRNLSEASMVEITISAEPRRIIMAFNNGFIISGRLHTAKKEIEKSLKFDIQAVEKPQVEAITIKAP